MEFLWSKHWAHQGRFLSPVGTLLAVVPSSGDLQQCALRIRPCHVVAPFMECSHILTLWHDQRAPHDTLTWWRRPACMLSWTMLQFYNLKCHFLRPWHSKTRIIDRMIASHGAANRSRIIACDFAIVSRRMPLAWARSNISQPLFMVSPSGQRWEFLRLKSLMVTSMT